MTDMEPMVREALAHTPQREPEGIPEWNVVRRPAPSAPRFAAAALVAVVAWVSIVFVAGGGDGEPSFLEAERSLDPITEEALETTLDTAGWNVHTDDLAQIRLLYPSGWVAGHRFTPGSGSTTAGATGTPSTGRSTTPS